MEDDTYLGDGLYGAFDGWQIELYAWDGRDKTNRVYLEPAVLARFLLWVDELKAERRAKTSDAKS
jgi:hypothetical protein